MSPADRPDVADLVMIAARVLDLTPAAALDLIDLEAAEAALVEVRRWCEEDPVEHGAAALLTGLVSRQPLARDNHAIALVATLQFVGLHGWDLRLDPPEVARELTQGVAAGTVDRQALTDWMAARLRPRDHARQASTKAMEDGMLKRLTRRLGRQCSYDAGEEFGRFTDRARGALTLARHEARQFGHNWVGTEHVMLGLLGETSGVAARALHTLGIDLDGARVRVERDVGRGPGGPDPIPFTPRTKKVLQLARLEAGSLGHNYVGTEHLLLGLVREGEGLAAQILTGWGADPARIVQEVMRLLTDGGPAPAPARRALVMDELAAVFDDNERLRAEIDRLRALLRRHGIEPDGGTTRTA